MQVGDLVSLIHSTYDGYGVITKKRWNKGAKNQRHFFYYTVHWQNGEERDTYCYDELEVVCK